MQKWVSYNAMVPRDRVGNNKENYFCRCLQGPTWPRWAMWSLGLLFMYLVVFLLVCEALRVALCQIWRYINFYYYYKMGSTTYSLLHLYWSKLIWNTGYFKVKQNPQFHSLIFFAKEYQFKLKSFILKYITYFEIMVQSAEVIMYCF
jgi:hypothetical protein